MRDLTKRQKELLTKWYKEDKNIRDVEGLPFEKWEELQQINDTEILYQNVNNFLWDLRNKRV